MFSYQLYKVIHLASVFFFLGSLGASFFVKEKVKIIKILTGMTSFLILVGGMGLLARLGFSHGESFPFWVLLKMGLWLTLAIAGPLLARRLHSMRAFALIGLLSLAVLAAYAAVYKPGL